MSRTVNRYGSQLIARIPSGRNGTLAILGAALFGMATRLVTPRGAAAAPYPCSGPRACNCCSLGDCCGGCTAQYSCGGSQCWAISIPDGTGCYDIYRCCDWSDSGGFCACSVYNGKQC